MPGLFIDVVLDPAAASDAELSRKLVEVCPVGIFARGEDGRARVVEANLDECVLCDLCLEAAPPGALRVVKLYEE
jgi:NAD-dependent dihydropyrimidine dehydrogenase PreA subunit